MASANENGHVSSSSEAVLPFPGTVAPGLLQSRPLCRQWTYRGKIRIGAAGPSPFPFSFFSPLFLLTFLPPFSFCQGSTLVLDSILCEQARAGTPACPPTLSGHSPIHHVGTCPSPTASKHILATTGSPPNPSPKPPPWPTSKSRSTPRSPRGLPLSTSRRTSRRRPPPPAGGPRLHLHPQAARGHTANDIHPRYRRRTAPP